MITIKTKTKTKFFLGKEKTTATKKQQQKINLERIQQVMDNGKDAQNGIGFVLSFR